ncbi:hypothetical protein, partial [Bianquea renquensis]|uniref:hypothetical protein n=1 Tax=Bianquea renquensis TaxID=2763661 RepID=UPI00201641C2
AGQEAGKKEPSRQEHTDRPVYPCSHGKALLSFSRFHGLPLSAAGFPNRNLHPAKAHGRQRRASRTENAGSAAALYMER